MEQLKNSINVIIQIKTIMKRVSIARLDFLKGHEANQILNSCLHSIVQIEFIKINLLLITNITI